MRISTTKATLYAVLFGLAVGANVFLWLEEMSEASRAALAVIAFAVCAWLLRTSFKFAADHMTEQQIRKLGAEE